MKSGTKSIIAVGLGGIAVGALLGVLFAPAEGKKTRAAIKNKTSDLVDKVSSVDPKEIIAALRSKIESKFQDGKSDVKDSLLAQIQKLEAAIEKA